jgi:hypothetical protein
MAKGSKKLNQIQNQPFNTERSGLIPAEPTNIPEGLREHFGDKYKLIFEYYDHSVCDMTNLTKQDMKRAIESFTKITKRDHTNIKTICRPSPVKYTQSGNYAKYFKNIPPDFDLLMEVYFTGSGRIMVHLYQNFCCVIAVSGKHN